MARRFLDKKTHYFYFLDNGERKRYVLIFGDEVNTRTGTAPSGADFSRVEYRGRLGEWKEPPLSSDRSLEMYFLDVGQGAFRDRLPDTARTRALGGSLTTSACAPERNLWGAVSARSRGPKQRLPPPADIMTNRSTLLVYKTGAGPALPAA